MERNIWHIRNIIYQSVTHAVYTVYAFFPVTILVLPGISCDTSVGWFMAGLMGSCFFLFDPALPRPIHGLSDFLCLGMACCFSRPKFGV